MTQILDDRIRIQIEIALAGSQGCPVAAASREQQARAAGLSGAEIDAARHYRCFDVRAAAAVRLACSLRDAGLNKPALVANAHRAGLSRAEIEAISALALSNPEAEPR